ncbi:hypothetical protein CEP54_014991 [Fusarium duplospermum]|uniref:Transketolase N-terminal domain-containing protein n=1 Tax=Fusarium duplospermum TaxID=1325734 RepID=A0A428NS93_9HYPO|nr:hypothetical protein CEP54_014991 [Fusarium duplospermum]
MSNTADPQFREVKGRQGGSHIRSADLFRLDGRTVIITGGAGYLGIEVAGSILETGGDVICLDVLENPPAEPWSQLNDLAKKHDGQISYQRPDVTNAQAIPETFASFVPGLRYPIRGFVGCAGVSDNGPAHEFSIERFRRLMEINVTGTFAVAQAVALEMKKANVDGSMVLVASMSGTVVNKQGVNTAAYNTSKSGVLQLARSLAAEWGSRKGMPLIRVNSLSPGYIRTPATAEALKKPGMEEQWTGDNMGMAPMAHVLFNKFLTFSPQNPEWLNRDRLVLSNGHGCMLQYALLHLYGYDISMDDLKDFRVSITSNFRQYHRGLYANDYVGQKLGSKTPGHPEAKHTPGVEVTTGPLGQGVANAVGLAMAQAHTAAVFNKPGYTLIDNFTYCFLGDGCLMEGVASEASSLAGHLQLGNLICVYDDNHISIDGDIDCTFTEDVVKRYESYGWHVLTVDDGDGDLEAIAAAFKAAQQVKDKPSLIKVRTTIGYGSLLQGTYGVHGNPLKEEDIRLVKLKFGFDP